MINQVKTMSVLKSEEDSYYKYILCHMICLEWASLMVFTQYRPFDFAFCVEIIVLSCNSELIMKKRKPHRQTAQTVREICSPYLLEYFYLENDLNYIHKALVHRLKQNLTLIHETFEKLTSRDEMIILSDEVSESFSSPPDKNCQIIFQQNIAVISYDNCSKSNSRFQQKVPVGL
jgi:hypothetical protein